MSDQSKKRSSPGWVLIGIVILCLAGVWLVRRVLHDNPRAFSGSGLSVKAEVRNSMESFVAGVKQYRTEYGHFPFGGNAEIVAALRGKNPRGFTFFAIRPDSINTDGAFTDPWGTPYRLDLSNPENPRVWSCGKNRRDDGGAEGSDDIPSWR